jgi:SNF2 family DNA or RNA helicase
VFKLITHDTIEEQVWNLSQRKRTLFDEMVVAGETLPAHITDQELRSLFDH